MTERVYIKATIRRPELVENALLVFRTLRTGFPDNPVTVLAGSERIAAAARQVDCHVVPDEGGLRHDDWIAGLLEAGEEPFWICDPDVIFYGAIRLARLGPLTGPLEPEHWSPYTQAWHAPRLHTCLLRIDPAAVRERLAAWWDARPGTPWEPRHELVRQVWSPGPPLRFFDTLSRLWAAVGGAAFDEATLDAFSHLHAGSFTDLLAAAFPDMARAHAHFRSHPEAARGLWRRQLQLQQAHRPKPAYAGDPLLNHQP